MCSIGIIIFVVALTMRSGIRTVRYVLVTIIKLDLVTIRRFIAAFTFRTVTQDWFAFVINPVQAVKFSIVFRTIFRFRLNIWIKFEMLKNLELIIIPRICH